MSNPIFEAFRNTNTMNNGLLQRFQQFQRTFQGDPRQQIQQLMNSGRINQQQYNQATQMARQLQQMLRIK